MIQSRKLLVVILMNTTILVYCVYFYFQGRSLGKVAVVLVVSAIFLNVVAEFAWRAAIKKNRQASGKSV